MYKSQEEASQLIEKMIRLNRNSFGRKLIQPERSSSRKEAPSVVTGALGKLSSR